MKIDRRTSHRRTLALLVLAAGILMTASGRAQVALVQLSQDTLSSPVDSGYWLPQHDSEVEPGAFSNGSTMVTAFQVARRFYGGSGDIGFATSTDNGATWTNGFLPGITIYYEGGYYSAASDPSVAYDALHNVWLISSLTLDANGGGVLVSRSTDAINWMNPVPVTTLGYPDKNWTGCDDTPTSPYYGHCYTEWEDTLAQLIFMSTSTDGGLTWSSRLPTAGNDYGVGGIPLVQPGGTVIVPIKTAGYPENVIAFTSTNGGQSWNKAVYVANIIEHFEAGGIRSGDVISAAMDAEGTVYAMWSDCRFRKNCVANDIVYSTSADGTNWSAVKRVPIDIPGADRFITGLSIAPGTGGPNAELALAYYFYPVSNCSDCQLYVGFIQSATAGKRWTTPETLAGPMSLTWLPITFTEYMVADYISVGFAEGRAFPIFALALKPTDVLQQAIYTTATGQDPPTPEQEVLSAEGDRPVPNARSDHGPTEYMELERRPMLPGPASESIRQ